MTTPVLSVAHAAKAFGAGSRRTKALDDVSFTVNAGERVALLGRNGAGKSTLVRGVGALVGLDAGEIRVGGLDVARSRRALGSVGITLEGGRSVYWRHTPFENVRYFARLRGADPSRACIDELLEGLQVPRPRSQVVGKLSTGNKQKVAIACALVHDPALLMLDEPTLGLDVDAVAHIRRLVAAHAERRQGAFVITSHDLGFVADVCERVIVLHRGQVRYDGRLSVMRKEADGYRVRVVLDETAAKERVDERWADRVRAEVTRAGGTTTLSFQASGTADVFHAFDHLKAAHPAAILDVDVSKASLEAAYVRLSAGALS